MGMLPENLIKVKTFYYILINNFNNLIFNNNIFIKIKASDFGALLDMVTDRVSIAAFLACLT